MTKYYLCIHKWNSPEKSHHLEEFSVWRFTTVF